MKELLFDQCKGVSGGNLGSFFIGWAAGNALNYGVSSFVDSAYSFSGADHSESNRYFLENTDRFNPLL